MVVRVGKNGLIIISPNITISDLSLTLDYGNLKVEKVGCMSKRVTHKAQSSSLIILKRRVVIYWVVTHLN